MKSDQYIIEELVQRYGNDIKISKSLPKPYPETVVPDKVKAIYLGCDPTNTSYGYEFQYVFALIETPPEFKGFLTYHTNQLKAVGLDKDYVFFQNLCRNYFQDETNKNLKVWKKVANGYWVEKLNAEIKEKNIPVNVPVFLTSKYLFDILVTGDKLKSIPVKEFYENPSKIPILAKDNLLNRPLIPVYRGKNPNLNYSYTLSNGHWENYRKRIIEIIHKQIES
jgi:hypothetical protein